MRARLSQGYPHSGVPAVITDDKGKVLGQVLILGMYDDEEDAIQRHKKTLRIAQKLVDGLNDRLPRDVKRGAPCRD